MNSEDLKKLLLTSDDKFSLFADPKLLDQYNMTVGEFEKLINEFLTDSEKARLFQIEYFKNANSYTKRCIMDNISDSNILLRVLEEPGLLDNVDTSYLRDEIIRLSDDAKQKILHNKEFFKKHEFYSFEIIKIIDSLSEENKVAILSDNSLTTDTFKLDKHDLENIIESLQKDEDKMLLMDKYTFDNYISANIIKTMNDINKEKLVVNMGKLEPYQIKQILTTFEANNLLEFFEKNGEFCKDNKIEPYEVISELPADKQLQIALSLTSSDFSIDAKRKIFATLGNEVKEKLNKEDYPQEFKGALSVKSMGKNVLVELGRNPQDYAGLDELMVINPEKFSKEQKEQLKQICRVYPDMHINNTHDNGTFFSSTGKEFIEGENWIESVLSTIKPEFSKAQKIAIIDNAIGKRVSYSPDFDTEVFEKWDNRALWKIISRGYGVCNGISRLEQYMLEQVGIQSKMVSGKNHAFLKIENMGFELANGEKVTGTTIVDPTWNLALQRYGCKPNHLFLSYEDIRKRDIAPDGKDTEAHKNDEELKDATFTLDQQNLRNLCASVGLTRQDGQFPVLDFIEKSKKIDEVCANEPERNIDGQLKLIQKVCPEFAKCQNSTMQMLRTISFNNPNLKFKKCVIDRVYKKEDKSKAPVMFVYFDSAKFGKKFYYADKEQGQFIEIPSKEFEKRFECYDRDLEKNHGRRLWEDDDISQSINSRADADVAEGGDR